MSRPVSRPCEMGEGDTVPATGSVNAYVSAGDQEQCCEVAPDVWNAPYSQIAL